MRFSDWFDNYLNIGEKAAASDLVGHDVVIDVNCSFDPEYHLDLDRHKFIHYWFPLTEVSIMPIANIIAVLQVLAYCHDNQYRVYLHCSGGVNRSVTVAQLFYWYMTGRPMVVPYKLPYRTLTQDRVLENQNKGVLIAKRVLLRLFVQMRKGSYIDTVIKPEYSSAKELMGKTITLFDNFQNDFTDFTCIKQRYYFEGPQVSESITAMRYNYDWEYTE